MASITNAELTSLLFAEQASTPTTPGTGLVRGYFKSDGYYFVDDAGTETKVGGATTLDGLSDVDVSTVAPTDGQALLFDDSDATWKPGTVSSGAASGWTLVDADSHTRTAGDISATGANGTTWFDLLTATDLTLSTAAAGDRVEVGASFYVSNSGAFYLATDVATVVSGSPVTYFGTSGASGDFGVQAWLVQPSTESIKGGVVMGPALGAGDISAGSVTLRLRCRTSAAGTRTVKGATAQPFHWWAKLWRPA